MKNLRIGITIEAAHVDALWVNGLHLNVLFLYHLLKKSKNNYYVCLLTLEPFTPKASSTHLQGIPIHTAEEKYADLDLIITMGTEIYSETIKKYKKDPNKKIISYRCGNTYLLDSEKTLFKPNFNSWFPYETSFDEIWYVPQQHENNQGLYKTLHRTNAIPIPFLWHFQYIKEYALQIQEKYKQGIFKKGYSYNPNKGKKTIGILEPNLNIIKYCLIPTLITEECYRTQIGKDKIENLLIGISGKVMKHETFLSVLRNLDIYNDGRITSANRLPTGYIVSQHIDIVISHQLCNALNYLYMDVAYMGYPVLHNAWMCKDIGYYYESSDVQQGAKQLKWILEHHDSHRKEYAEKNSEALFKYSIDNPKLLLMYEELIQNLYTKGGNGDKIYIPETNTYKN
jgi:hypothetical protein